MIKLDKNYYRNSFLSLIDATDGKSIIVSGKFKYKNDPIWCTFTSIRPYVKGVHTRTFCNHINLRKKDIERFFTVTKTYHNRKFYIIGIPTVYEHYGVLRGCLKLDYSIGIPPIFISDDLTRYECTINEFLYTYKSCDYDVRK